MESFKKLSLNMHKPSGRLENKSIVLFLSVFVCITNVFSPVCFAQSSGTTYPSRLPASSDSSASSRTATDLAPDVNLHAPMDPIDSSNVSSVQSSLDEDYQNHLSNLRRAKHSAPSKADTGAPNEKQQEILKHYTRETSGPGKAIGEYDVQKIDIPRPKLESLISVNQYLSPFSLDATSSTVMSLRTALMTGLERNLDLAISRANTKQSQFAFYSALGNFLPDPTLGYSEYFTKGEIGLPFALSSLIAASGASSLTAGGGRSSTIHIDRPVEIMHAGAQYFAYRGGSVLFGSLQARNSYRAAKHQEHASLRDTLMTITQNYYNLVLAETLLKIRIDAVKTSEEQLRRNQDRFHSGLATNLEVLQSKTQLSRDRQALVDQQANRRNAAITLSDSLNLSFVQDLVPIDLEVHKIRLVDSRLDISQLLRIAIDSRPELKQYEELRLAAKKAILVSAANLQPSVALSGNVYGIGPPSNVQALGVFAVNINWRLRGMGIVDSMDTAQARWQARQATLQAQKELQTICGQVRNSYVRSLDKERNVEESSNEVQSALEELRLAELRKSSGLGLNLDIITAQRDYTQARVSQAQAIIDFNIAQAQLLHDVGVISTESLTSHKVLSGMP
jgi:outer membrane protein TolC